MTATKHVYLLLNTGLAPAAYNTASSISIVKSSRYGIRVKSALSSLVSYDE